MLMDMASQAGAPCPWNPLADEPATTWTRIKRVYMAGPLFTEAERAFNIRLSDALSGRCHGFDFILPQDRGDYIIGGGGTMQQVIDDCFSQVAQCDIVLANLDGADADSGTCVEIGYALALKKRVIGYRTDFREAGDTPGSGMNGMLFHGIPELVIVSTLMPRSFEQLVQAIGDRLGN